MSRKVEPRMGLPSMIPIPKCTRAVPQSCPACRGSLSNRVAELSNLSKLDLKNRFGSLNRHFYEPLPFPFLSSRAADSLKSRKNDKACATTMSKVETKGAWSRFLENPGVPSNQLPAGKAHLVPLVVIRSEAEGSAVPRTTPGNPEPREVWSGAGHTNGAPADLSLSPDFLSRVVASVNCTWFSFGENHRNAGKSCRVGNPGTLRMIRRG